MTLFQQTIQNIAVGGSLTSELDTQLQKLIASVKESGKAGSITLHLDVKPLDSDGAQVQTKAKVKLAVADREYSAIFFTTEEDMLVRDNPEQTTMKLEPVPKAASRVEPIAAKAS